MSDIYSREKRSEIMSQIGSRSTKPEIRVRKLLHHMGYRFRLNRKDLPGTPDIVLPKYRKVIFVHGCFWHGHEGCRKAELPKTNREFWERKISANREHDRVILLQLAELRWDALVIWQCRIKDTDALQTQLRVFFAEEHSH